MTSGNPPARPSDTSMTGRPPLLRAGDVLLLPESEYRYGVGPVIVQVAEICGQVEYRDEPWWLVSGAVANGTPENHGGFVSRDVYIRQASLFQNRQPSGASRP